MDRRATSAMRIPALVSSVALLAAGCGSSGRVARGALQSYVAAVQGRDLERLYCLSAGAAGAEELGGTDEERRAGFRDWARAQLEAYREGRDAGWVEPDEHGIVLVKMFSLGRGTYYTVERPRPLGEDSMIVRMDLRFGYGQLDLSRFSPGTTLYLCGAPVGTIHAIRVPERKTEVRLEVLESVALDWTLVRTSGSAGCPGGWAVASVAPVAGSETVASMTWTF